MDNLNVNFGNSNCYFAHYSCGSFRLAYQLNSDAVTWQN
jgi:hypothetical protein